MIYLYWYLGIGIVVLLVHKAFVDLRNRRSVASTEDAKSSKGWKWQEIIRELPVVIFGVILLAPFWPVLLYFEYRHGFKIEPKTSTHPFADRKEFVVTPSYLLLETSILEVERNETVFDPLGAVPKLPFGHLNTAWQEFLSKMQPGDKLFSFAAKWDSSWWPDWREGYVIVRGEEIGPYFLTMRKALQNCIQEEKKKPNREIPSWLSKYTN